MTEGNRPARWIQARGISMELALPPKEIEATFAEAARVLEPGGWIVHLDFLPQVQPRSDAFTRFIHYGHAKPKLR